MAEVVEIKANNRTGMELPETEKSRVDPRKHSRCKEPRNELDPKWLPVAWKAEKKFNLNLNGTVIPVMIKELQLSGVSHQALHVDSSERENYRWPRNQAPSTNFLAIMLGC